MGKIDIEAAADAVIHTWEMFQVGADGGLHNLEFRYVCAEEIETVEEPWAKPLAAAIRKRIDVIVSENEVTP